MVHRAQSIYTDKNIPNTYIVLNLFLETEVTRTHFAGVKENRYCCHTPYCSTNLGTPPWPSPVDPAQINMVILDLITLFVEVSIYYNTNHAKAYTHTSL